MMISKFDGGFQKKEQGSRIHDFAVFERRKKGGSCVLCLAWSGLVFSLAVGPGHKIPPPSFQRTRSERGVQEL